MIDPRRGWLCHRETIRPEWIDPALGLPDRYCLRLAAHAIFDLTGRILTGGVIASPPPLFFTLETRLSRLSPFETNGESSIWIRPISRTEKVVRLDIQIFGAERADKPSARCELIGGFADHATRRLQELSPEAKLIYDEGVSFSTRDAERRVPPEPFPGLGADERSAAIQVIEGVVEAEWIDRMGHMGIEHYGLIFDRATRGALGRIGGALGWEGERKPSPKRAAGSAIKYLKEMKLGQRWRCFTSLIEVKNGEVGLHHWIVDSTEDRELAKEREPGPVSLAECRLNLPIGAIKTRSI